MYSTSCCTILCLRFLFNFVPFKWFYLNTFLYISERAQMEFVWDLRLSSPTAASLYLLCTWKKQTLELDQASSNCSSLLVYIWRVESRSTEQLHPNRTWDNSDLVLTWSLRGIHRSLRCCQCIPGSCAMRAMNWGGAKRKSCKGSAHFTEEMLIQTQVQTVGMETL